jgi:phosphatidylinositol alpha-1,6-mannosyltransferase
MKILLITDSFPPAEGGSRSYYYNIYKHFKSQEVIILTKKVNGWKEFDKSQNIRTIRKGRPLENWKYANIIKTIPYIFYSLWIVIKYKIEVLHCGDLFPAGIIGLISKYLLKKPFIIYCHAEDLTLPKSYRFQPKIYNFIYRNAAQIIAACEYARSILIKDGLETKKIVKINPGVDYYKFKPMVVTRDVYKKFNAENKKVILSICRLIERKGIDSVIKSLPEVLEKIPNSVYLIAGRGNYRRELEDLVGSLNLSNYVRFLGFVGEEELPVLYNICDVFIMCNKEIKYSNDVEGFGMVFMEASATAKPVIGGDSGGTQDSIADGITGYIVNAQNTKQIAHKLIELLNNVALAEKMGSAGRERALKHFGWQQKAKQVEEINLAALSSSIS